jgi:hypothetical protein
MYKKFFLFALCFIFLVNIYSNILEDAEYIATKAIPLNLEKDEVIINKTDGIFRKLIFKVTRRPIAFNKIIVFYKNKDVEEIPVKWIFKKGDWIRVVDLKKNTSAILKVVYFYKVLKLPPKDGPGPGPGPDKKHQPGPAILDLYGLR